MAIMLYYAWDMWHFAWTRDWKSETVWAVPLVDPLSGRSRWALACSCCNSCGDLWMVGHGADLDDNGSRVSAPRRPEALMDPLAVGGLVALCTVYGAVFWRVGGHRPADRRHRSFCSSLTARAPSGLAGAVLRRPEQLCAAVDPDVHHHGRGDFVDPRGPGPLRGAGALADPRARAVWWCPTLGPARCLRRCRGPALPPVRPSARWASPRCASAAIRMRSPQGLSRRAARWAS